MTPVPARVAYAAAVLCRIALLQGLLLLPGTMRVAPATFYRRSPKRARVGTAASQRPSMGRHCACAHDAKLRGTAGITYAVCFSMHTWMYVEYLRSVFCRGLSHSTGEPARIFVQRKNIIFSIILFVSTYHMQACNFLVPCFKICCLGAREHSDFFGSGSKWTS